MDIWKKLLELFIQYWYIPALLSSLFYGIRGAFLWYTLPFPVLANAPTDVKEKHKKIFRYVFDLPYQFIFNFAGALAGWCCLYVLITHILEELPKLRGFTTGDVILFIVALIGTTGHLPQTVYGFVQSFNLIVETVTKRITQ
jgi:hypothetical protein